MPASFVTIGDEPIRDPLLARITVSQELNHHTLCTIVWRNTMDEPIHLDEVLGKDIKVATQNENGEEIVVFVGFALDGELDYEIAGAFTARLTAVSLSYKLEVTPQHRYFLAKTLREISATLAGEDGLEVAVNCSEHRPLNYVQYGETDFAFLNRMADDHNAWLRPTTRGIEIANEFRPGGELKWREELGLVSFKAKGTLRQPSFNGHHYDHHKMKSQGFDNVSAAPEFFGSLDGLVEGVQKGSEERIPPGYVNQRARAVTIDDYATRLKAESIRSIGGAICGVGESLDSRLKPGDTVTISGPAAFAGTYGLVKVTHTWTPAGYFNQFECTPWKHYRSPQAPKVSQHWGLIPARVVAHNDPKKMGRIKVRYFWQDDGDGHWARFLTPHAGGGRGFMFMPEIGDEVIVGFEDGDAERPFVLGCVWNGVDTAPREKFYADDDMDPNYVKRIMTKSGNRIQIVDKPGHEAIVLSTPNSAKVTLIENAAETGRTMLSLYSTGDILLAAPNGRVHIQAAHFSREVGS
jgi:uncharacterized protein involved in type VI secretion and phage assembly